MQHSRIALLLGWTLFFSSLATAQKEEDFAGSWSGVIETAQLAFLIELVRDEGTWSGSISIPVQDLKDQALINFVYSENSLTFEIAEIPGKPTFRGVLADEGRSIRGRFRQGAADLGFSMQRVNTWPLAPMA